MTTSTFNLFSPIIFLVILSAVSAQAQESCIGGCFSTESCNSITGLVPEEGSCLRGRTCCSPSPSTVCLGRCFNTTDFSSPDSFCPIINQVPLFGACPTRFSCCGEAPIGVVPIETCSASCFNTDCNSAFGLRPASGQCNGGRQCCARIPPPPQDLCNGRCFSGPCFSQLGLIAGTGSCPFSGAPFCCLSLPPPPPPRCFGSCSRDRCSAQGLVPAEGQCSGDSFCCARPTCQGRCIDGRQCPRPDFSPERGSCSLGQSCCQRDTPPPPPQPTCRDSCVSGDRCPNDSSSAIGSCARGQRCCKRNPPPPPPPQPMMCQGQCTRGRCMGNSRPAPGICSSGQTCCARGGGGRGLFEDIEAACKNTTSTNSSHVDDEDDDHND